MTALTYSDVLIKPQYSEIESRSNVDVSTTIGNGVELQLPVITANMKTVTGYKMARCAAGHGSLGMMHRFCSIEQAKEDFLNALCINPENGEAIFEPNQVGVSIGIKEEDKRRFEELYEAGARIFCIDIAHGHHVHMKNMLHWINNEVFRWDRSERGQLTLVAGNIATGDAYYDLTNWGADVVKVGIGPGSVCQTRKRTGCGVPQLHALKDVQEQRMGQEKRPSVIADGGIAHVGDIAKSLKYADAVMMGSYFAGTSESPGHAYRGDDGTWYKVYQGSASAENKGKNEFVEGITTTKQFQGEAKYLFREILAGLQSSFSYVGANNLEEFKNKCEFVQVTGSGSREGHY